MTTQAPGVSFHDLSGGGQVGELIRRKNWATTTLGSIDSWSRSLSNHLNMIFELPTAAIIFWGPTQIQLYNEGYSVIMGPRHPQHLGSTFRECWPEAYDSIYPWMQRVLQNGETVEVNKTLVPLTRFGFTEEAYFTFSFSPLRNDKGEIEGILQLVIEVTEAVLGERRNITLRDLSNQIVQSKTQQDAIRLSMSVLSEAKKDIPFALMYSVDSTDREKFILSGSTDLSPEEQSLPRELDLRLVNPLISEVSQAVNERKLALIEKRAAALPIMTTDQSVVAVLIVGLSPSLAFDERYQNFLQLISSQVMALIAAAYAHEEERKRVEVLAQWAQKLEIANKELEAFSYSVSHDLRAPLRTIDGFSRMLLEDHSTQLDAEGHRYLERVRSATQRMAQLIDDLIGLSQITRASLNREKVPLVSIAKKILSDLKATDSQREIVFVAPDSVTAKADSRLLTALLENLIGNAWKFTSKQPLARIELGFEKKDNELVFFIRDNGAGFNMEYANKLFTPFQRLHSQEEFKGTGIGLATVQRIIARHGGRIWAEASPNQGATFFFTLGDQS